MVSPLPSVKTSRGSVQFAEAIDESRQKAAVCDQDGDNGKVSAFGGMAEVRREEPREAAGVRSSRRKGGIRADDF